MRHHGGRCRIFNFGVGDRADHHAAALGQGSDGLNFRMIQGAGSARAINTQGIDTGLVPGGVGMGRIGRVGDDGVGPLCRKQGHVGHVVHRQLVGKLAALNSFGQDARGRAVPDGQTVADEQNHILCDRLGRCAIDAPVDAGTLLAVAGNHSVKTGLANAGVAQQEAGNFLTVFPGNQVRRLAQHLAVILAIDRDLDLGRIDYRTELNLEVKMRTRQHVGAGQGKDGLRRAVSRKRCCKNGHGQGG